MRATYQGVDLRLAVTHWNGVSLPYPAPAKLNLFLHVLGRRPTATTCCRPSSASSTAPTGSASRARDDGEIALLRGPFGDDNLCVRAARLLKQRNRAAARRRHRAGQAASGRRRPGRRLLRRRDGAARAQPPLAPRLGRAELVQIAPSPWRRRAVLPLRENALGEGIGERLTRARPAARLVPRLMPQVSVSTKEIFAARVDRGVQSDSKYRPFSPGQGQNDLEPVVTARYPEVAAQLAWLQAAMPAGAHDGFRSVRLRRVRNAKPKRARCIPVAGRE